MARWGRARRLMTVGPRARVLDLGCAFGYGTRLLARDQHVYGRDLSPAYVERARRALPQVEFTCGPAEELPYASGWFDAVVMLDVLEHLPEPAKAITELSRVIRPGGELILSVPHRGLLASFDSLNLYRRIFRDTEPAPTDDPSWPASPYHRHFGLQELDEMLAPCFRHEAAQYTGLGLAELINLLLLIVVLRWMHKPKLFGTLQYLYFAAYIVEDELSVGRLSYHVLTRYRRAEGS